MERAGKTAPREPLGDQVTSAFWCPEPGGIHFCCFEPCSVWGFALSALAAEYGWEAGRGRIPALGHPAPHSSHENGQERRPQRGEVALCGAEFVRREKGDLLRMPLPHIGRLLPDPGFPNLQRSQDFAVPERD